MKAVIYLLIALILISCSSSPSLVSNTAPISQVETDQPTASTTSCVDGMEFIDQYVNIWVNCSETEPGSIERISVSINPEASDESIDAALEYVYQQAALGGWEAKDVEKAYKLAIKNCPDKLVDPSIAPGGTVASCIFLSAAAIPYTQITFGKSE